jgi:Na+/melibiose symporter-like transporter
MLEYFIELPFKAVPGALEADVLTRLGLTAGPMMGASALIALVIYSRYNLTRDRHKEIMDRLASRPPNADQIEPLRRDIS